MTTVLSVSIGLLLVNFMARVSNFFEQRHKSLSVPKWLSKVLSDDSGFHLIILFRKRKLNKCNRCR